MTKIYSQMLPTTIQVTGPFSDVNKTPDSPNAKDFGGGGPVDTESYEKAAPAHGDLLFHEFLMKIQENPGQILR